MVGRLDVLRVLGGVVLVIGGIVTVLQRVRAGLLLSRGVVDLLAVSRGYVLVLGSGLLLPVSRRAVLPGRDVVGLQLVSSGVVLYGGVWSVLVDSCGVLQSFGRPGLVCVQPVRLLDSAGSRSVQRSRSGAGSRARRMLRGRVLHRQWLCERACGILRV